MMTAEVWERLARAYATALAVDIVICAASSSPDDAPGWSPKLLAAHLEVSLHNVAYHVRLLAKRGVLVEAGTAQRHGAVEHYYRIAA